MIWSKGHWNTSRTVSLGESLSRILSWPKGSLLQQFLQFMWTTLSRFALSSKKIDCSASKFSYPIYIWVKSYINEICSIWPFMEKNKSNYSWTANRRLSELSWRVKKKERSIWVRLVLFLIGHTGGCSNCLKQLCLNSRVNISTISSSKSHKKSMM